MDVDEFETCIYLTMATRILKEWSGEDSITCATSLQDRISSSAPLRLFTS